MIPTKEEMRQALEKRQGKELQQEFAERLMAGLSDEDQEKLAVYFSQMEKNLDQIIKGDEG